MDATSAPDLAPRARREVQRFATIVVVGGGCYGSYYVRQLHRAARAGAIEWERLLVVDRDAHCPVARLAVDERPVRLTLVVEPWAEYFGRYLAEAAASPDRGAHDAVVPSPLMPHLMADWLLARARERWPGRSLTVAPLDNVPAVRWQRAGDDGTHYVSFADWMCPINCVEPARCPHTKGPRDWSMPVAIARHVAGESFLFHCVHRAYGVGMIDVRDVVAADAAIAASAEGAERSFVVGTVSHCHGALRRIVLGG